MEHIFDVDEDEPIGEVKQAGEQDLSTEVGRDLAVENAEAGANNRLRRERVGP
jgi:hypothetical protein